MLYQHLIMLVIVIIIIIVMGKTNNNIMGLDWIFRSLELVMRSVDFWEVGKEKGIVKSNQWRGKVVDGCVVEMEIRMLMKGQKYLLILMDLIQRLVKREGKG